MKKHYRKENDCLNCGTILQGKFCHNCGQENLEMKESFGHMLNHAISDYFHFDYQFLHTLKPLFFKPGKLTTEYNLGHRAQYLHPVKMYIFISLVFFVLFFKQSKHDKNEHGNEPNTEIKTTPAGTKSALDKALSENKSLTPSQKKALEDNIKTYLPDTVSKEISADLQKDSIKGKLHKTYNYNDGLAIYDDDNINKFGNYEAYLAYQGKLPENKRDNYLQRYIVKKTFDWKEQGKNGQEILFEGLKHNAPKIMFLLLPLFALILKLAFWENHKLYVEHIIYAIHLHCFLFLFLIVVMLLKMVLPDSWEVIISLIETAATFTIIWYIYRSLRVVYNRSRWRTISKMVGVSFMYSLVFGLSVFIIIIITAITTV
jgi:hypothetical protein